MDKPSRLESFTNQLRWGEDTLALVKTANEHKTNVSIVEETIKYNDLRYREFNRRNDSLCSNFFKS